MDRDITRIHATSQSEMLGKRRQGDQPLPNKKIKKDTTPIDFFIGKHFDSIVPMPNDLPDIPYEHKEFAFRFAVERRPIIEWAEIFRVGPQTIRLWLSREDVREYVMKVKACRYSRMLERMALLEDKAISKLSDILEMPLTADTSESIRKAIGDIIELSKNGTISRNIKVVDQSTHNYGDVNTQVNFDDPNDRKNALKKMKGNLEELELLENAIDNEEV